jgi:hypothetical protein
MNKIIKGYMRCMKRFKGCLVESYAIEKSLRFYNGIHARLLGCDSNIVQG